MKADYKNWMPKGMIACSLAVSVVLTIITMMIGVKKRIGKVMLAASVTCALLTHWMYMLYRAFSYDWKRQMSKQIIDGVSSYVKLPDGGKCLDVGCGSGALSIAVAKKNPTAHVIGIDRWDEVLYIG